MKKLFGFLCAAVLLCSMCPAAFAASTEVIVGVPDRHTVIVNSDEGKIYADDKLCGGQIEVERHREQAYRIEPGYGKALLRLIYDGRDVTAKVQNGFYIAPKLVRNASLTAVYQDVPVSNVVMKKLETEAWVNGEILPTTEYVSGYAQLRSLNGTYIIPLRYIAEVSGFDVAYLGGGQIKVTNRATGEYLIVNRDSDVMTKYSAAYEKLVEFTAPQPIIIEDGITYAPARTICEALGLGVCYQATSHGSYIVISTDTAINAHKENALGLIEEAYALGL